MVNVAGSNPAGSIQNFIFLFIFYIFCLNMAYKPEQIEKMIPSSFSLERKHVWPYILTGALYAYFGMLGQGEKLYVSRSMTDPFFIHDFAESGRGPLALFQGTDVSLPQEEGRVRKRYFLGIFDSNQVKKVSLMELMAAYQEGKRFGEKLRQDSPPDGSVKREELDTRAICLPKIEISDLLAKGANLL